MLSKEETRHSQAVSRVNEYSWVKYIKQRINKNKNFITTLTGPTGSGKSWTALSIGEMLDKDFNIDRVVFSGTELMNLINSGNLKSGSVIVWDEAGVNLSNRNWQALTNKLINYLLQTFRHKNFVLIFTVPYTDFVDAATRKLFHADFQTVSVNETNKTCKIKPKMMQYNANLKKMYYHYLRMYTDEGITKIKRWNVPKPSDELIEAYEMKKNRFTKGLNKNIGMSLRQIEEKDGRKPLTELQTKIVEYWKQGISIQKEIAKKLGRSEVQTGRNIKWMRNKGYFKEDYLKK